MKWHAGPSLLLSLGTPGTGSGSYPPNFIDKFK
jgi:hypothetical protein